MTEQRHSVLALHPAVDDDESTDARELLKRRQVLRRTRWAALVVLLLLAAGGARTLWLRQANARALEAGTAERAVTYVKLGQPGAAAGGAALQLPGTLAGAAQSPVAARASGYLKRWTRDIGSRVRRGELLAEIDTPETDQQLAQAVAARDQAAASLALARSTVQRWEGLRAKDVVSQQDLDERRGAEAQATANLAAAEANVQRLRQLEGFKRISAPFDGVLTRRNVEVGDLVDAGAGRPLFVMTQTDTLRVFVGVPQSAAQRVKPGQAVSVTQAELPGRRFEGKVMRTAGAIDPATRTLQVEVSLPNPEGLLLPGAYVQVALSLGGAGVLTVPTNALLFRAEGVRVALVDGQGRVALKPVRLGRNLGESVEVPEGLAAEDRFVLNPSDSIADGDRVQAAPAKDAAR